MDAITDVPLPANEPIHDYAPGSGERTRLKEALGSLSADPIDLPHVIGGDRRIGDGDRVDVVQPHRHSARLGTFTNATHADATAAIEAAMAAKADWEATPFDERAAVFLRAADLLAGPWREKLARRHHARPVQDRLPGRDRRGVRADRLLAVQRRVRSADPRAAADQHPRRVEPHRLPAAGGLRLRDHAVQLHRDRGQPADARPR